MGDEDAWCKKEIFLKEKSVQSLFADRLKGTALQMTYADTALPAAPRLS